MSPKRISRPLDIYIRVPDVRGRTGDSFIAPQEQEDCCRAALASRGLEVGEVFRELDVSGKTMQRPELAKARERIEDGVSGEIVVVLGIMLQLA